MNPSNLLASLLASSALAAAAQGSSTSTERNGSFLALDTSAAIAPASDPSSSLTRPIFDRPGDGAIWAHGRTYKAKFDRKGVEYVPFLGSGAPRDYPIDFAIRSVRVGSSELGWQSDVEPELDGETVTFHRGAFDEVYVVGPDSIEQNFVVRERGTSGDLHVVVHADTELERADSPIGTAFGNELGGVRVGKASTRDARDRAVRSLTRLAGESIEIVVPQNELERADLPLAIDPLIATWTVTLLPAPTSDFPDTSYDLTTDTWLCVDQETFSATDHDVVARQFTSGGTMLNQVFIDSSTSDWTRPRVANNYAQRQFMAVAEVNASTTHSSIQARTFNANTAALSSLITVAAPNTDGTKFSCPDIGGDDYPLGTPAYCVAFIEGAHPSGNVQTHAWASLVSPVGTVVPKVMLGFDIAEPLHISKSDGHWSFGGQRWTVGYTGQDVESDGSVQLFFTQVTASGTALMPLQTIGPASRDYNSFSLTPLLDETGTLRHFGLASIITGLGNRTLIFVQGTDASGNAVAGAEGLFGPTATGVTAETDGARIYVAHSEMVGSRFVRPQPNIYLDTWSFDPTAGQGQVSISPLQTHVLLAGSTDAETMPVLASKHSSGGVLSEMLCIFKRVATVGGAASILGSTLN